jgi:NADH-quinone oxidoreductase subunit L
MIHPAEHLSHVGETHVTASWVAFLTALAGFLLATVFYAWRKLNPEEVKQQFRPLYTFLWHKWYFDELYNYLFVQPVLFISRRVADFDRQVIDRIVDGCALAVRGVSTIDDAIDRLFVDGLVNWVARAIHSTGLSLRRIQTGRLRQYVMFVVVGTVALFIVISFYWNYS